MHIPAEYLRPFPAPEDVFAEPVAEHARHFLPICSVDLRFLQPDGPPTWLHFVQPAAIFDGCVGETTSQYHDMLNFKDSMAFDIDAQGKYRFAGDWRYFSINSGSPEERAEQEMAYQLNHLAYGLIKAYYRQHGQMPDLGHLKEMLGQYEEHKPETVAALGSVESLLARLQAQKGQPDDLLEDLGGQSDDMQEIMQEEGIRHVDELMQDGFGNLGEPPANARGQPFRYVGCLSGYSFQLHGCDELYLFYEPTQRQAVIRLVYS